MGEEFGKIIGEGIYKGIITGLSVAWPIFALCAVALVVQWIFRKRR